MPQFSHHAPSLPETLAKARSLSKLKQSHFPIGVIGESNSFGYGFNGEYYYVTEGVFSFLVSKVHFTLDEAEQLFNALTFIDASEPSSKIVSMAIKSARKQQLSGDDLMWNFVDSLEA